MEASSEGLQEQRRKRGSLAGEVEEEGRRRRRKKQKKKEERISQGYGEKKGKGGGETVAKERSFQ
jgi:hypothetical protein